MPNYSEETKLAVISTDIAYIKSDVAEIKRLQQNDYVTKDEFLPVKRIAYGLIAVVGTILAGILVWAITALIQAGKS